MKKLLIIGCIMCAAIVNAVTVKYTDLYIINTKNKNEVAKTNSVLEVKNIKPQMLGYMNITKIYNKAKQDPEFASEFDTLVADYCPRYYNIRYHFAQRMALVQTVKKYFPKTFNAYLDGFKGTTFADVANKYNTISYKKLYMKMTFQEFLDIYSEIPLDELPKWKTAFVNKVLPKIKRYIRAQGKSFITRTITDESGKKITINPMKEYTTELTNILNGPRLTGLNEFISKLGFTETFDASKLPDEASIKDLMDKILVDEVNIKLPSVRAKLEKCLGVEGFNRFVKVYNEGGTF